LSLQVFSGWESVMGRLFIYSPGKPLPEKLVQGSPAAANAALDWLSSGAHMALRQQIDALVTGPVSKAAIIQAGNPFIGQTEYLSQLAGTERTAMMLLGEDDRGRWLRVVLATTHLPLHLVPSCLTPGKIELAIELAAEACRLLRLPGSRVGVCGLNPHAGEDGQLGMEEATLIAPAVLRLQARGLDGEGPLPADTLFYQAFKGEYDVVVSMYHDQGLCPLKMIGFETGVNWTLGLPFIRTSPDHGTAYSLAGKNLASPSSMISALRLARNLAVHRQSSIRPA
jgi:4-hydroxythreonine-4-phosphate dehydrogenase